MCMFAVLLHILYILAFNNCTFTKLIKMSMLTEFKCIISLLLHSDFCKLLSKH